MQRLRSALALTLTLALALALTPALALALALAIERALARAVAGCGRLPGLNLAVTINAGWIKATTRQNATGHWRSPFATLPWRRAGRRAQGAQGRETGAPGPGTGSTIGRALASSAAPR
jgi:hypothetical protein